MRETTVNLRRVRASFEASRAWSELSGELPVYLFVRPLSFYVTLPLFKLGVRANSVTSFAALVAASLPLCAYAFDGAWAYGSVAFLGFVFIVLDCVDGNLARLRAESSRFGALLDGAVDALFDLTLPLAVGILVLRGHGSLGPYALALGLATTVATLAARRVRDEFRDRFGVDAHFEAVRPARVPWTSWLFFGVAGLENLYPIAIAIGGVLGRLEVVLASMAGYAFIVLLVSSWLILRRARALEPRGP